MKNSIVNITRFFMILTGLWKLPLTDDALLRKCYTAYSLLIQSTFTVIDICCVMRFIQLAIGGATSPAKLFGCLSMAIILSNMLVVIFILTKRGIPHWFSYIMEEEVIALNSTDEEIRRSYLAQTNYYKVTTLCQIITTLFSAGMFAISTIIIKIVTGSIQDHEVFLWFPFDESKHEYLVMAANSVMSILGYFICITSRLTPTTVIIFANAQLSFLQIRIRRVFSGEDNTENIIQSKVKELVKKHQDLISFVTSLNHAIKYIIFLEYVLSSINVAAAVVQIITVTSLFDSIFPVFHLTMVLFQFSILAWSGNELNIQSANIADAVYESNWMDQSESIKRIMFIMLMRAQKPLALTIGPFSPINFESALVTMKGAYSYSSVMLRSYT